MTAKLHKLSRSVGFLRRLVYLITEDAPLSFFLQQSGVSRHFPCNR
uniref:Uncharacterized protein n=1 Tax=Ascaris lumbricoides TaxID=6252 RepID=A0A0M3I7W4_ASCLU